MLQNVTRSAQAESVPNQPAVHSVERTGVRSLRSFGDDSLPPCYITQMDSTVMKIAHVILPIYDIAVSQACTINRAWYLSCLQCGQAVCSRMGGGGGLQLCDVCMYNICRCHTPDG